MIYRDHFVRSLNPGSSSSPNSPGWKMLDIAGGTGDIAFRLLDHATNINNSPSSTITISDINPAMLAEGKKRSLATSYANSPRLSFLVANAEELETIGSNSIDLYTVAFGIRNFTNKEKALREAFRVLKPGGVFACLEFSGVTNPLFDAVYKRWSFSAIPLIGQLVAGDRASYQYLVESIEKISKAGGVQRYDQGCRLHGSWKRVGGPDWWDCRYPQGREAHREAIIWPLIIPVQCKYNVS
jgi:2-methoxy-6-polyprenyl-1,4-benzoquinol methylase